MKDKYLLILKQEGQGCDDNIDCGTKVVPVKGIYFSDAIECARMEIRDNYLDDETGLCSATLVEVLQARRIDLDAIRKEASAEQEADLAADQERAERAEFERLKKKYG